MADVPSPAQRAQPVLGEERRRVARGGVQANVRATRSATANRLAYPLFRHRGGVGQSGAASLAGWHTHAMAGFDVDRARTVLNVPMIIVLPQSRWEGSATNRACRSRCERWKTPMDAGRCRRPFWKAVFRPDHSRAAMRAAFIRARGRINAMAEAPVRR